MAIYRLSASIVKRSAGRSVCAAAAYRAGERLDDPRTGEVYDYRARRGVDHTEIITPDGAPDWARDRAQLWASVELAEKRKDAQLAREIQVAVPRELNKAQALDLVRGWAREELVKSGMVADIAWHGLKENHNPHAHILLSTREIGADGWGKKVRAWNDKARLESWRKSWAEHVNRALSDGGHSARVDHRANLDRGLSVPGQPKLGAAAAAMERRGIKTERGDKLRAWRRDAKIQRVKVRSMRARLQTGKRVYVEPMVSAWRPEASGQVQQPRAHRELVDRLEHQIREPGRTMTLSAGCRFAEKGGKGGAVAVTMHMGSKTMAPPFGAAALNNPELIGQLGRSQSPFASLARERLEFLERQKEIRKQEEQRRRLELQRQRLEAKRQRLEMRQRSTAPAPSPGGPKP